MPLAIAVNVSAVRFHRPDFVATPGGVLLRTGLDGSRLETEIIETALIRDPAPRAFGTAPDRGPRRAYRLGLGCGLGLPTLAEGVETDRELKFPMDENCTEAQG